MALKRAVVDPPADHAEDRQSRRHPQLPTTTTLLLVAASCLLGKRAVPSKRRHGFGCGRAGASGTASQHMPHTPAPRPLAPSVTQLPYPRYAHGMARAPRFSHRSPRALTSGVICESVPVYFRRVRAGLSEVHKSDHPVSLQNQTDVLAVESCISFLSRGTQGGGGWRKECRPRKRRWSRQSPWCRWSPLACPSSRSSPKPRSRERLACLRRMHPGRSALGCKIAGACGLCGARRAPVQSYTGTRGGNRYEKLLSL